METLTAGCCGENSCWSLPPEFVRVKYFYGQRLGVMELSDEAVYHAGKHAFHNAREHGAGVLCGLRVDLFVFTTGAATTVLRVRKGAAVDACGREIVVGGDQCVDVAAWYANNKSRPELASWTPGTTQKLYVAVRYRECPSDPCAAPRDPCGCDNGGCEFGRVREGFELALLTAKEKAKLKVSPFPSGELLQRILAEAPQSKRSVVGALDAAIDEIVALECPAPDDQHWLALAEVDVTLDQTTGAPAALGAPEIAIPLRVSLLPTSALQALLLDLLASNVSSGALAGGPKVGALTLTAATPTSCTLDVAIDLARAGSPPAPVALVQSTFQTGMVSLERLDPSSGWGVVTPGSVAYSASPSQIAIALTGLSGVAPPATGPVYRLTISAPAATPIVDSLGRPLTPTPFSSTFAFGLDANGYLTLVTSL